MIRHFAPVIALLLAGCGQQQDEQAATEAPVAAVRVALATAGNTSDTVTAYGAAEADPAAQRSVTAPAEAIVGAVLAPTGTSVTAGQALVTLVPSRGSRLEAAKAASDARVADAALARAMRLRHDGLVSDADVETARAASATAHATIASVGIGDGGLTLRAPAAGTVQNLTLKPGDQVAAGIAVAAVATADDVRVRFGIEPADTRRIHPGQDVRIALLGRVASVTARVVGVDPAVDPTTRLASVYARVPRGLALAPGEPLRATVQLGSTTRGVSIPYAALLDDGGASYVFVVRANVAKRVAVVPGDSGGDRTQVLSGLQPGDAVVVEGGGALEDGMKVRSAGTAR